MYRNKEYYPDPTAGAALAHIARDERAKKRQATQNRPSSKANVYQPARQKKSKILATRVVAHYDQDRRKCE